MINLVTILHIVRTHVGGTKNVCDTGALPHDWRYGRPQKYHITMPNSITLGQTIWA